MELVIGDKLYSTWSLRPWLVLKRCGADFTETVIRLNQPDTAEQIALHSPAGRVPVLKVDGETIWDSLAISVWCAERYPEAGLWPADAHARWQARSVVCEMHSGFMALRDLAIAIQPVIPTKAAALLDQLGIPEDERTYAALNDTEWFNRLVASGFTVAPPTPLFPRLELPADEVGAA